MYGVIVSESSMNKCNIFADPLCFEIKNRRQGPKTAGYRRKPAAISNPATVRMLSNELSFLCPSSSRSSIPGNKSFRPLCH
jgi:hypothetical protein